RQASARRREGANACLYLPDESLARRLIPSLAALCHGLGERMHLDQLVELPLGHGHATSLVELEERGPECAAVERYPCTRELRCRHRRMTARRCFQLPLGKPGGGPPTAGPLPGS